MLLPFWEFPRNWTDSSLLQEWPHVAVTVAWEPEASHSDSCPTNKQDSQSTGDLQHPILNPRRKDFWTIWLIQTSSGRGLLFIEDVSRSHMSKRKEKGGREKTYICKKIYKSLKYFFEVKCIPKIQISINLKIIRDVRSTDGLCTAARCW